MKSRGGLERIRLISNGNGITAVYDVVLADVAITVPNKSISQRQNSVNLISEAVPSSSE
jgi:hypothetical protein